MGKRFLKTQSTIQRCSAYDQRIIAIKTLLKLAAQSKQRLPFGKISLRPNRLKRSNALSRHTTKQAETNLYPPKKTVPSSAMAIKQNALAKTTYCP